MIRVDTWSAVRRAQIWLLASILLISVLPVAHAQSPTGTLIISVHDPSGAVVADVQLVLSGSGLERTLVTGATGASTFESVPPGRYTITATRSGFVPGTLRDVVVTAGSPQGLVVTLRVPGIAESVEVQARSYAVPNATTATKTETPLMETPFTVQVVPQQVIRDLNTATSGLADVLAYQGVTTRGFETTGELLGFRGFFTSTTLWNGFRLESIIGGEVGRGGLWMGNADRLEVMKGPSGILYGRNEPGGIVNVQTRKPREAFGANVRVGTGSWSNLWVGADVSGSLNQRKSVLYRVYVDGETSDSYFTNSPDYSSRGVAPALTWKISPRSTLSVEGEYRTLKGSNGQSYIPIDPAKGDLLSVDPSITRPVGSAFKANQYRTMVVLDHRVTSNWALSLKAMHDRVDNPSSTWSFVQNAQFPIAANGALLVDRNLLVGSNDTTSLATTLDVTGRISLLGAQHTVLFGAEYYDFDFTGVDGLDFSRNPAYRTDYFNQTPINWDVVPRDEPYTLQRRSPGFYVQDQIALPRNWHLLIGGRYQRLRQTYTYNDPYSAGGFFPRAGLLWRAKPWLSSYYSYSENMSNATGFAFPRRPLPPEQSRQHELGVKTEWMGGRLNATVALFDITKYNLPSADPEHETFNIALGEVQSRGVELGLQGELTSNWSAMLNFTSARPEVVVGASGGSSIEAPAITAGRLLPYVNNQVFSLLTNYRLPWTQAGEWKVGGGVNWASDQNPSNAAQRMTAKYTGYTVASAFASYARRIGGHTTTLNLNVNNLFNERYFRNYAEAGSFTRVQASYGPFRQIKLSMNVAF